MLCIEKVPRGQLQIGQRKVGKELEAACLGWRQKGKLKRNLSGSQGRGKGLLFLSLAKEETRSKARKIRWGGEEMILARAVL